jgi:imidazolonepropionase
MSESKSQTVDLVVHSARQLLTLAGGPQRGSRLGDLGLIEEGALALAGGVIVDVGPSPDLLRRYPDAGRLDASGQVVMPGFVDCHTHLVWAGDRAAEFEMRLQGASYMEIMQAGGGITSTVRQTKSASFESLLQQSEARADRMLAHGTTTAEAKTGYGLELEAEIRLLDVILALDWKHPLALIPTFLGAHAVPQSFAGRAQAYADLVSRTMLPEVKRWWEVHGGARPLPFVDVFCEEGAFNLEQSRQILEEAGRLGFPLKLHVDEFKTLGGAKLALDLGAASADHMVCTPMKEIRAFGRSETVAVALPATPFGLAEADYTPARQLIAANALLAVGSDLNPGTAWCESMQLVIALACRYLKLTPAQAIACTTINAAAALQLQGSLGSLEIGKQADVIGLQVPDFRHLGYRFGTNLVSWVVKSGKLVFPREDSLGR